MVTIEELAAKLSQLEEENTKLKREIRHLEQENINLRKKVSQLERRLAVYENANTPPSLRRFDPPPEESHGKPGRHEGHEGETRPIPTPDETVEATTDKCPYCNAELGKPAYFETKTIEDIPAPQNVKVTEYLLAHYDCKCGRHVAAKHPDCPEKGRFGPNLQAEVALMSVEDRLPMRKIIRTLGRRHGLKMSSATVCNILDAAKDSLLPEYGRIGEMVATSEIVNADETTFPVNGKDWWLWGFRTGSEAYVVLDKSRGKKVVEGVLDGKQRIICSDGYAAYNTLGIQQRCWAHLIRQLKFAAEKNPRLKPVLEELQEFFRNLKERIAEKPPPEERQMLMLEAKEWMKSFLDSAKSRRGLRKFVTYARNGADAWFTFIEHEDVEPTNNSAEQLLREHVVRRKIIGTLRNAGGAKRYAVLSSVIATWRMRGLNPQDELVSVLRS